MASSFREAEALLGARRVETLPFAGEEAVAADEAPPLHAPELAVAPVDEGLVLQDRAFPEAAGEHADQEERDRHEREARAREREVLDQESDDRREPRVHREERLRGAAPALDEALGAVEEQAVLVEGVGALGLVRTVHLGEDLVHDVTLDVPRRAFVEAPRGPRARAGHRRADRPAGRARGDRRRRSGVCRSA